MTQAEELREHAERCRRLAASATDQNVARILIGLADEYVARAERLERQAVVGQSYAPPATPEQQPAQQQQQVQPKKEDE